MSFDDSILANIKTQQDSDDDDDDGAETFMEVGLSAEDFVEEHQDDPLLDGTEEEVEKKEFPWICSGDDFLKPYRNSDDEEDEAKIARLELRGVNGQVWSKVRIKYVTCTNEL